MLYTPLLSLALSFPLSLVACATTSTTYPTSCELEAPVPETTVHPGDKVWATDTPLSSVNDTVVTVGSVAASVIDVQRTGCDDLDTCRSDNACTACGQCDACASEAASCVERVRFTVPEVEPGDQVLTVRNAYGSSRAGVLTVLRTDTADTGTGDSSTP